MTQAFNTIPVPYASSPEDLGLSYETVHFPTQRQLQLHGWWIPCTERNKRPVLVLLHGWKRNAERMMPYIEALHNQYNLFVFDSRNHGKSDSDSFSSMPRFSEDIVAALDYLEQEKGDEFSGITGLLGLSMGGGAAIHAASFDQRVSSVVSVGAFANPGEVMRLEYRKRHIPFYPMVYLVFAYFQYRIGQKFIQFAPESRIAHAQARFLLIHGEKDKTVPYYQAERLLKAAKKDAAELWNIPSAGHSNCHKFPGYWEKIEKYLAETLG